MSEQIQKVLFVLSVMCFTILLIIYSFMSGTEYYEIHKSWATQQCVKMIVYTSENPEGIESECPEILPEQYHNVWVK